MSRAIQVYRSNRTEVLADALAELLATPVGGPLEPEWIVVQGRGMAVWLGLELSRRHGVWAGGGFLYPRNFVGRAFERVLGEEGARAEAYSRQRLVWVVMALLGEREVLSDPDFSRLARYVARDDGGRRRHQLAQRIAGVLDQYLTYRPDMLLAWERGDDGLAARHGEAWQPKLWRRLVERLGSRHTASLERDFVRALRGEVTTLPPRIAVFGLSSLPPMYVRVLAALSQHADVHWFMPSPARGYWADVTRRHVPGELALETVDNPLLASLGKLGGEMIEVLGGELEAMAAEEQEPLGELYRAPDATTLLGRLQADMLDVKCGPHRGSDATIRLHACHSPMREVEVLHDQLLELIDQGVAPHEMVVMTPDVAAFAPLVEAVFERDRGTSRFIPHCIADRSLRSDSPVIEAFHRILDLAGGRARASEVLDLLTLEPIQRRYDIAPDDVDVIAEWVHEAGIRWGVDAGHRAQHGQPPVHENTWRFGLERLLLGYAMRGDGHVLYAGRLPFDEIEGQEALLLGKLASFCQALFEVVEELAQPRPLAGWHEALGGVLERMLAQDADDAWQHQRIRQALTSLADAAADAELDAEVGIEVVRAALAHELDETEPARGFLSGGVTFCAMVPMRSVPFRVVCMLGMSDGAFPRAERPIDFDLMRKERRAGDRCRRDDDRYLFLEALLAARDRVIITYTGQSVRDDSPQPASVVVGELVDYLVSSHGGDETLDEDERIAGIHPQLLTRHPLQPFSPRYFDGSDPKLFSYVEAYRLGAHAMRAQRRQLSPLFDAPLPPAEESSIALAELLSFFANPLKYLLNRRLGVDLGERSIALSDREPVELDPLERYALGDALLALRIEGFDEQATRELARASGLLPPGTPGHLDHDDVMAIVEPIAERVKMLRDGGRRPDLELAVSLPDGTQLTGEVSQRWAKGVLWHQFARVSGRHVLSLWIRHLALCLAAEPLAARRSHLVGRGEGGTPLCVQFRKVDEPAVHLAELVRWFREGQTRPLQLFPKAGYAYVRELRRGKAASSALWSAQKLWWSDEHGRDPHVRRVFDRNGIDPEAFAGLSEAVFGPLLDHMADERLEP